GPVWGAGAGFGRPERLLDADFDGGEGRYRLIRLALRFLPAGLVEVRDRPLEGEQSGGVLCLAGLKFQVAQLTPDLARQQQVVDLAVAAELVEIQLPQRREPVGVMFLHAGDPLRRARGAEGEAEGAEPTQATAVRLVALD